MSDKQELIVPAELAGERLDRLLRQLLPGMTRSAIQRLIKEGYVTVEGQRADPNARPLAGARIIVEAAPLRQLLLTPENLPLDIVYEDEQLLVVNKPAGLVVHPGQGHARGTLVNALLAHCRLSAASEAIRPGIVHRLDQYTSGLLLVAKTEAAHTALSQQVESRIAQREYWALVWGRPQPAEGTIRTGYGRHPRHRTLMTTLPPGQGRWAITHYRTLECFVWKWTPTPGERPRQRQAALVECRLETGRTHQIRVHMAHLGCPIVRDPEYGDPVRDTEQPETLRQLLAALPGQALHAGRLRFYHPKTGEEILLEAPPPEEFQRLLAWLRKENTGGLKK